jgi:anti-anti-sigma factor
MRDERVIDVDLTSASERGVCIVRLRGELDVAAQPAVGELFRTATDRAFEVDLLDLAFMDCSGYRALVSASEPTGSGRRPVRVTGVRGEPAWFLALLDDLGCAEQGLEVS